MDGEDALFPGVVDAILDEAAEAQGRPFEGRKVQLRAVDAQGTLLGGLIGAHLQRAGSSSSCSPFRPTREAAALVPVCSHEPKLWRERTISSASISTPFDFQAPRFYLREGYREIGRMPKIGEAPQRIWFAKVFNTSGSTT